MKTKVDIPKERYEWALARAGLTVDGYSAAHPNVPVAEWMSGGKSPTVRQLETFADSVSVPFGYLFLDTPPEERIPFPMFRGAGRAGFDLNVYDTIAAVSRRQEWLEEYLAENEVETCRFVGRATLSTPVPEAVGMLREALGLDPRWAFSLSSPMAAVGCMTKALEAAGVFVACNGIVGNNTRRRLEVCECRGFALVNAVAPYIFVNSGDAPAAQLFTLAHEAAHLLLGISAGHGEADGVPLDAAERYCDMVAAEFLVPAAELRSIWAGSIGRAARSFCVSEPVAARRAHDAGLLSDGDYRAFWAEYSARPARKARPGGGGDFYRTSVRRVGHLFAIHVRNAVESRQLSHVEAYRLTGLYGDTYSRCIGA